jgi:hypothetical protein
MAPSHSAGFRAPRPAAPVNHGGRFGTPRSAQFSRAPAAGFSRPPSARFSAAPGARFSAAPGTRFSSAPTTRFSTAPRTRFSGAPAARFDRPPATRFNSAPSARFNGAGDRFRSSTRGPLGDGRVHSAPRFDGRPAFRPGDHNHSWRPGFNRPIHSIGVGGRPRYWRGGYFHGYFWPRAHYHHGFVRFVTVLPAFYSTYWFAGVPYYYWDDTYYTWSPAEYGYVATDPPPAVDDDASDTGSAVPESSDSSSVYIYPKNGQSEEQTATDRYECHQWAAGQTGFDPTSGVDQSAGSSGPDDYRRAMIACLDGRGYSAR